MPQDCSRSTSSPLPIHLRRFSPLGSPPAPTLTKLCNYTAPQCHAPHAMTPSPVLSNSGGKALTNTAELFFTPQPSIPRNGIYSTPPFPHFQHLSQAPCDYFTLYLATGAGSTLLVHPPPRCEYQPSASLQTNSTSPSTLNSLSPPYRPLLPTSDGASGTDSQPGLTCCYGTLLLSQRVHSGMVLWNLLERTMRQPLVPYNALYSLHSPPPFLHLLGSAFPVLVGISHRNGSLSR